MIEAGIEAMNAYCGSAAIDVAALARHRRLDNARFDNLLMKEKTVPMLYEDPISNGVNAAKPIFEKLGMNKDDIDLLITTTESGVDFGKSMSTYIHHHLGLSRNCRLFEIKNACYSGTAGFQMAVNSVLSGVSPGKKALVIATDIMRTSAVDISTEMSFAEPSTGSGAVAMIISDSPTVFKIDQGATGCYGYEVMDTCRPVPDEEAGNSDLSLLSYLDCCENSFKEYQKRVAGADYQDTFHYLAFHTPFGGMIKGAHRANMRKFKKASPDMIESDFQHRVVPSLNYCQRVGNIMGASTHLALASAIDNGDFSRPKRIGIFSYGSGCCSEFYSGIVTPKGKAQLKQFNIDGHLNDRTLLSIEEYEHTLRTNSQLKFGLKDCILDQREHLKPFKHVLGKGRLIFTGIQNYHRKYEWV